jgi:predicted DNA-binding ribbon-helix-helix protein
MRSNAVQVADRIERVQTGVRMEKRIVNVLKAIAELRDLALGELLEELVQDAFAGRRYFEESALPSIRELSRIYGLELPLNEADPP